MSSATLPTLPMTEPRRAYAPSRRAFWPVFVPLALLAILTAAVMAVLLRLAFEAGLYVFVVTTMVLGLPVGGAAYCAVRWGRCRSLGLAAGFGVVCVLVFFLGYFYVSMIADAGTAYVWRLDLLPEYIHWQMSTMQTESHPGTGRSAPKTNTVVDVAFHYFLTSIDLFIATVACVGLASLHSRIPYWEQGRRWMSGAYRNLPGQAGLQIGDAIERGDVAAIAKLFKPNALITAPFTRLIVHFVTSANGSGGGPIYLSVVHAKHDAPGRLAGCILPLGKAAVVRMVEITPREAALLTAVFPELEPVVGNELVDATRGEPASLASEAPPSEPRAKAGPRYRVEMEAIATSSAGRIMSEANLRRALWLRRVRHAPWIIAALCIPMGIGVLVATQPNKRSNDLGVAGGIGIFLICAGAICLKAGGLISHRIGFSYSDRFLERTARDEIRLRTGRWVDPDSAASIFVAVVQHEGNHPAVRELKYDVGFLQMDDQRRVLAFEGDSQRFRIPRDAITSCDAVEVDSAKKNARLFFTVVGAKHGDAIWEVALIPYLPMGGHGVELAANRVNELRRRIVEWAPHAAG